MKVTLIMPSVGRKPGLPYVRSWQMEPLALAVLSALTPEEIHREFFDDRLEAIPYERPTDLAAINVETYTARRAYQIADEFRKRKVPVVMGGFHATLVPDEVSEHADATIVGAAERVWPMILDAICPRRVSRTLQRRVGQRLLPDHAGSVDLFQEAVHSYSPH